MMARRAAICLRYATWSCSGDRFPGRKRPGRSRLRSRARPTCYCRFAASQCCSANRIITFSMCSILNSNSRYRKAYCPITEGDRCVPFQLVGVRSSQQRLPSATATRLAAITDIQANLEAQLSELSRLRDQLRKAQLLARGSRRTSHARMLAATTPTPARSTSSKSGSARPPPRTRPSAP